MTAAAPASRIPDRPSRRAVAGIVAGVIGLVAIGVAASALFPDACAPLEIQPLGVPATDRFPDGVFGPDAGVAEVVEGLRSSLDLGRPNGAVDVESPLRLIPADGESVVVLGSTARALKLGFATSTRQLALGDQGLVAVAAYRGAAVIDVNASPRVIAVMNGDLERLACGILADGLDLPVAVDRSRVLHADGLTLLANGLDGSSRWEVAMDAPLRGVALIGASAVNRVAVTLDETGSLTARSMLDGEIRWSSDLVDADARLLAVDDDAVLIRRRGAVTLVAADSGEVVWRVERESVLSGGLADGRVIIEVGGEDGNTIETLDAADGSLLATSGPVDSDGVTSVGHYTGIVIGSPVRRMLFFGPFGIEDDA